MIVRQFFRALRTLDHLRHPRQLWAVQQYASGDFAIVYVDHPHAGITLFDEDASPHVREFAAELHQGHVFTSRSRAMTRRYILDAAS